mmetsp:Transcript_32776/g.52294  ORF Transcript_32776/g.52294 Transcript_32776/m.52294 type:complete len:123 (-) Transcript_32776:193-561(-)
MFIRVQCFNKIIALTPFQSETIESECLEVQKEQLDRLVPQRMDLMQQELLLQLVCGQQQELELEQLLPLLELGLALGLALAFPLAWQTHGLQPNKGSRQLRRPQLHIRVSSQLVLSFARKTC